MKKQKKMKSSKKSKAAEPELPELVTVMAKFLERIEAVEKKIDQVINRILVLPSEVRAAAQNTPRPAAAQPNREVRERTMYKAVCADCFKNCEVPFKPVPDRPIYCKECWAIRKVGHKPQDPDKRSEGPHQPRPVTTIPSLTKAETAVFPPRRKSSKGKKAKAKKTADKKKK